MYPFLQKYENSSFVKLHRKLYKKELLDQIKERMPDFVRRVMLRGNYYLVELRAKEEIEYFVFLNYLISLNQEI